ncbi:HD-GYP domain-containing protein [Roseateles chitosanitabidus]|uniref:HD-GYP domain-containing protein n=1 Tax=Roseateles chitosanitabidus TaxID=65048 RepID=UPI0008346CB2|nr:hypothetical protein [Roseateles chitosanitabidus]
MTVLDAVTPSLAADLSAATSRRPPAVALTDGEMLRDELAGLLASPRHDAAWLSRLQGAVTELETLMAGNPDELLYFLIHACSQHTAQYSATHAMICAVVAGLVVRRCDWPAEQGRALTLAAITMNLSMTELQDRLADQADAPSDEERALIRDHAQESARLLRAAGVRDELALAIVEGHHTRSHSAELESLDPAGKLSEVLRRIDVYTAKLSRRRQRPASTPALAARDALMDEQGRPDSLGMVLLRVLGLYPPGSWVELVNGDTGLVIGRGERAHTPQVAAVRRVDGGIYPQPVLRDTTLRGFAVTHGLRHSDMRISLNHAKVVACGA